MQSTVTRVILGASVPAKRIFGSRDRAAPAVRLFREREAEISLVLLDLSMPGLSGEETFGELRGIRPGLRVLLSSGYSEDEATRRFVGRGLAGFLQKPYRPETLVAAIRRALAD